MTAAESADGALARSQAARRRRVIDATLELAAGGGFDAVQMRDVAAEAGVALGTVYRYFESKERLLLEANLEQVDALRALLAERPRRARPPPTGWSTCSAGPRGPRPAARRPPPRWCGRSARRARRNPTRSDG